MKNNKLNKKNVNWVSYKSLIIAFIIASILNIFISAMAGIEQNKNIIWTALWIHFTIQAWKVLQWKALLPYPFFVVLSAMIKINFFESFGDISNPVLLYYIISISINIGGLFFFYNYTNQSQNRINQEFIE